MNPETIALSRDELRVWSLIKLGWRWGIYKNCEEWYLCNPLEAVNPKMTPEYGWRMEEVLPDGCRIGGLPKGNDPTRDIGEAWKLLPLVEGLLLDDENWRRVAVFQQAWNAAELHRKNNEEAAEWICCTIYWAVEGRRVELTDL